MRVVLAGISPLIWRQLDVTASTTLADLHRILQIAFGWSGEHLHRFTVRGVDYRACQGQGLDGKDAGQVTLAGLGLRVSERFTYEYAFFSNLQTWRHDIRVQAIEPARPRRRYPRCGGARGAPPEECGGPEAFLALRQEHSRWQTTVRMAELVHLLAEAAETSPGQTVRSVLGEDAIEELPGLLYWARAGTFDRRAVNAALAALSRKDTP
ncbi:MAG: plasmid pRiA4b ORF-3 family protein [Streptosporangiaceae bacterium]